MQSSFFQELKQRMLLSPFMKTSLQVLQMPFIELSLWIEEQIEQNPLLEWKEASSSQNKALITDFTEIADHPTAFDYLMRQAQLAFSDPALLALAEWIIGNLDTNGFYSPSTTPIPFTHKKEELDLCINTIRQFDPPGVCAVDLQDSLLLQLELAEKKNTEAYCLIQNHFSDLIEGKWPLLQKKLKKTKAAIMKIVEADIASLNPSPLGSFHESATPPLVADVFLIEQENTIEIELKEPVLPQLVSYGEHGNFSPEEQSFLKERLMEARWLFEAIKKRKATLQKVCDYLVQKQESYLKRESDTLLSLTIQEASLDLGLHESTILRAISGKNLSCSLGVVPLKNLFSRNLCEHFSCDRAQKILLKMIIEEDKEAPLSDRELLEKMKNQHGLSCSRRTLTKYRMQLNIPAKKKRKQA